VSGRDHRLSVTDSAPSGCGSDDTTGSIPPDCFPTTTQILGS
jgi:hypothetical protein